MTNIYSDPRFVGFLDTMKPFRFDSTQLSSLGDLFESCMNDSACLQLMPDYQLASNTNHSTILNSIWFVLRYTLAMSPIYMTIFFPETTNDIINNVMQFLGDWFNDIALNLGDL